MNSSHFRAGWRGCAALALLAVFTGCGGPATGKVSGRVLLDGVPLPGGIVKFIPVAGGNPRTVILDESGNYLQVELSPGEVMVCVDNRELQPQAPSAGTFSPPPAVRKALDKMSKSAGRTVAPGPAAPRPPSIPGSYVKINPKYYMMETSDLTFTVQRGDMTHVIELTSK